MDVERRDRPRTAGPEQNFYHESNRPNRRLRHGYSTAGSSTSAWLGPADPLLRRDAMPDGSSADPEILESAPRPACRRTPARPVSCPRTASVRGPRLAFNFSVFTHISRSGYEACLKAIHAALARHGLAVITVRPPYTDHDPLMEAGRAELSDDFASRK